MSSQEITVEHLQRWLALYAELIAQQEDYLTELDAAIGDADHGINMRRGTLRLQQRLGDEGVNKGVSNFLRTVAMTLIGSIGGAAGPLYGSFFLHAAQEAAAQEKKTSAEQSSDSPNPYITPVQLVTIFRKGLEGVQKRGKAHTGEKTMIDAMQPAIEAMEASVETDATVVSIFTAACDAAQAGMHNTIDMQAKKGRASYLGPRSIGHQDPGATSTYYLFKAALDSFEELHAQIEVAEKSGHI